MVRFSFDLSHLMHLVLTRYFLVGLAIVGCVTDQALFAGQTAPNFVLIVADDMGYGDAGFTGSKQIKTPNLDRLAAQGVQCTSGYVSSSVCSPSRAGLLTGRNQVTFGYDNNLGTQTPGYDPAYGGLPVDVPTIAERLRPLGYVSGLVGKWHLGMRPEFHPLQRGFDEFWGFLNGGHQYFQTPPGNGYHAPIVCNYKTPQPISYLTDDIGDECVDFIDRHQSQPFFLYASFNAPHTPMQATEDDLRLYQHVTDVKRRTYCGMVHRLDVNVGRIMKTLEQLKLAENTIVAFISDNGGPIGTNGSLNAPLNGSKGILLEGGMRVPFVVRYGSKLPSGMIYDQPVSSLDFAPTFVAAANGKLSPNDKLDGVNLIPFLSGEDSAVPHASLKWKFTISAAIRKGDWKLVRLPDRFPMLFNLASDISEQHDVALQHQELASQMLRQLGQWDVRLPHPVFAEGAIWKRRQLDLYDGTYPLKQIGATGAPLWKPAAK